MQQRSLRFEDRSHFYKICARLMRRVLVDESRSVRRAKRDSGVTVPFDEGCVWIEQSPEDALDLDNILTELEGLDPRKCRMVELRFYMGFTARNCTGRLKR